MVSPSVTYLRNRSILGDGKNNNKPLHNGLQDQSTGPEYWSGGGNLQRERETSPKSGTGFEVDGDDGACVGEATSSSVTSLVRGAWFRVQLCSNFVFF